MGIRFGPAGHSESYKGKTEDAAPWLAECGLNAFEVQCGHGVRVGAETADRIGASMASNGIALSVHSPYYISLSNPERLESSLEHIRKSCLLAKRLGAARVVVHTGGKSGAARDASLEATAFALRRAREVSAAEGWDDVTLCLETMGKSESLGDLNDVLRLCALDESFLPCIDFGHLYARSRGEVAGAEKTAAVLDALENALGPNRARLTHIHFSKIEFTSAGERRHRTFGDSGGFGPDWEPLASLLAERDYAPTVICESAGTQAEDAAWMKGVYEKCKG